MCKFRRLTGKENDPIIQLPYSTLFWSSVMYARTVQVSLPLFRDQQFSPLAPDSHVGSPFDLNISRLR